MQRVDPRLVGEWGVLLTRVAHDGAAAGLPRAQRQARDSLALAVRKRRRDEPNRAAARLLLASEDQSVPRHPRYRRLRAKAVVPAGAEVLLGKADAHQA
eukprot:7379666-Prymnesium_polylepis.1